MFHTETPRRTASPRPARNFGEAASALQVVDEPTITCAAGSLSARAVPPLGPLGTVLRSVWTSTSEEDVNSRDQAIACFPFRTAAEYCIRDFGTVE